MPGYKKLILAIVGILLATSVIFSYQPPRVLAQVGATVTTVVADKPSAFKWIWERAKIISDRVQASLTTQLVNQTLTTFMNKLAYDMASNIATGGPGKTPLFERESFTKSLQTARDAALGEFIGQISQSSFEDLGFNLCDPSLEVKLSLTLSLIDSKAPARPTCDWTKVKREWSKFGDNFTADLLKLQLDTRGSTKGLDDFFANGFSLEQTDLGVFAKLDAAVRQKEADAIEAKKALTLKCQGYLDNKEAITEDIKTSCSDVLDMKAAVIDSTPKIEAAKIGDSALKKEIGVIGQIMKTAGNIFVNTFTSKLMNRWIKDGMCSVLGGSCTNWLKTNPSLRNSLLAQLRGGASVDKTSGGGLFVDFQKIEPETLESYNILDEFAVCPEEIDFRKPDNCVISADFLQAVGSRITLQDAIDKGLISGSLPLIGSDESLRNANKECYKDALCYSNLVKLRKANIIPVGWEMAALRSSITEPATLQQVMDCFEADTGKCILTDPSNFYHLIDPYWVLKSPPALCNAYVYSPVLESPDTSNRQQYCSDIKTCLREDDQGNCLAGEYGYCAKTENIWRFTGDECVDGDIYSGCLTFQNDNLPVASYLEQSLDYCPADQAGCKRYSQRQNSLGDWILGDINTDPTDLFLNNKSASCPADYAGCSEYIVQAADKNINLIPNGDFEINNDSNLDIPDGFFNLSTQPNLTTPILRPGEGVGGSNAVASAYGGTRPFTTDVANIVCMRDVSVFPNTNYTISVDVKTIEGANGDGRIMVDNCFDSFGANGGLTTTDSDPLLSRLADDHHVAPALVYDEFNVMWPITSLSTTQYTRISGTFNSGNAVSCGLVCVGVNVNPVALPYYLFDNLKLEMTSVPKTNNTSFTAYGEGGKITMNGNRFMCTAQEVGCQGYTPSNGDPMIPAVISQNDLCPNECVGYASFAEEPDNFDLIENPSADFNYYNFISTTAKSCPATMAGCEEFTNVDAVTAGGEGREYYTYLRQCVPVDQGEDYITWEGTDVAGYQIRAWKALPSDVRTGTVYAPCTNILPGSSACNDSGAGVTVAACGTETASLLDDPGVNANCRQFFDPLGNSFYRLQDRVIFASDDCHDYRRTTNSTIYRAIPSLSSQCAAAQNGCRAYYGNTANNVRNIFTDDFERASYTPWQSITAGVTLDLSSESLEKNGHSLKINRRGVSEGTAPIGAIQNSKQYKLSWWMKTSVALGQVYWLLVVTDSGGTEHRFPISNFADSSIQNIAANNWQYYTVTQYFDQLNPTTYNLNTAKIIFGSTSTTAGEDGSVFLDNVMLKEVASNIYVIRNSWQTPVSCDTPYTGYHLGCQTYTDTNNNKYNLKSFQNLCRVEAIGCMAVIDTHNSDSPFKETYNSSCSNGFSASLAACTAAGGTWVFEQSEITVPADNVTYLVPDNRKYCPTTYKGCQTLGVLDRKNPSYLPTVYKINDPDQYASSLCVNEDLYCEEYSSDKGAYYFKDPEPATCTYQDKVIVGENIVSGWFKTDNLKDPLPLGCLDRDGAYDPEDFDLGLSAALCPADKNLCTTYYDPTDPIGCNRGTCQDCAAIADTECFSITNEFNCSVAGGTFTINDGSEECQAYYYYNNDKIDKASCDGQVNKNNGCALFQEANNWNSDHTVVNTNYDATQSYALNVSKGTAVSPVSCDPTDTTLIPRCNLDSNVLLKVRKDRQCSEWLACRSSSVVWDKDNNKYKVICSDIGTCTEFDSKSNVTKCGAWLPSSLVPQALTVDKYQDRATGLNDHLQFGDEDYTGYSVPNMLPIATLNVVNAGSTAAPSPRLVYNGSACAGIGTACTTVINGDLFNGVCREGVCRLNPMVESEKPFGVETRGYAQVDSPFPGSISPDSGRLDRLQAYAGANMCEVDQIEPITASPNGCEANYIKVTYGTAGTVRYYPKNFPSPGGICGSGNTDTNIDCVDSAGFARNSLCDTYNADNTSRNDGTCDKKIKAENIYNWPGICLEYDANAKIINDTNGTNYCNQWYPADQIAGTSSLYDNYREAGYYEPGGRDALFCSVTENYTLPEDRIYCGRRNGIDPRNCNLLLRVPAGSRISVNALASNSSLISYNYLRKENMNNVPPHLSEPDYMFEYIEKAGLVPGVSYAGAMFSVDDFVLMPGADSSKVPVVDRTVLLDLFNTYPNYIDFFYYDEDVNRFGDTDVDARIYAGDITGADYTLTDACVSSDESAATETPDSAPEDASGSCIGSKGSFPSCSIGGPWHQVTGTFCNPKDWNLYVKPELQYICDLVTGVCEDNPEPFLDRPCDWVWVGPVRICVDMPYTAESEGNPCGGTDQPRCYQQCKIVVDLDSEGEKSWVRTDIWWRNETGSGNTGRNIYPPAVLPAINTWQSWYFKTDFIQNAKVYYSGVTDETVKFTHFGSALGFLGNEAVNVRVPVNAGAFSPLAAATFYAIGTPANLAADLVLAHAQLNYIFYRVYNMQWMPALSAYRPYGDPTNIYVDAATTIAQNTQAGPDYPPVILQVCGSDVCRRADKTVVNGVTVNDVRWVPIYGEKSLFAALKFYYYAHPDHMPVKNIEINWGDGTTITSVPGKYKNNIPDCNVDLPMPGQALNTKQGFGGTERACREAYKTFYHDYQVSAFMDPTYDCDAGDVGEPRVDQASCYKPTVRVQDNWGNWSAWTSFAGWVVVTGKDE